MWLAIFIKSETYGRTIEFLALIKASLVPGLRHGTGIAHLVTIVIRYLALGVPGKTGEFNLSIPLDLLRHAWLGHAVLLWRRRLQELRRVWQFTHEKRSKQFRGAADACGVMGLHPCLCGPQRSRTSQYPLTNSRPLANARRQGGKGSHTNVHYYKKHDMVVLELPKLPSRLRDRQTLEEPLADGHCVECLRTLSAPLPGNTVCSLSSSPGAKGCQQT